MEVERERADRCIHFEGEGSSLLVRSRRKINKLDGNIKLFQNCATSKGNLGESTPGKYMEKESLWWNDALQQEVAEKRRLFREWQISRDENDQERYRGGKQRKENGCSDS